MSSRHTCWGPPWLVSRRCTLWPHSVAPRGRATLVNGARCTAAGRQRALHRSKAMKGVLGAGAARGNVDGYAGQSVAAATLLRACSATSEEGGNVGADTKAADTMEKGFRNCPPSPPAHPPTHDLYVASLQPSSFGFPAALAPPPLSSEEKARRDPPITVRPSASLRGLHGRRYRGGRAAAEAHRQSVPSIYYRSQFLPVACQLVLSRHTKLTMWHILRPALQHLRPYCSILAN
eukprot:352578-Chlamydomonas_euryale.AAC.3